VQMYDDLTRHAVDLDVHWSRDQNAKWTRIEQRPGHL
jgi:hypothetical protein